MIPSKLKPGGEIRVVSPARSLAIISKDVRRIAQERLEEFGFKVTFAQHAEEKDAFNSSSIQSRIEDLHDAFRDKNVKAILTAIGGFSSNQLLQYLDYDLIRQNPKILCGFSDITALANAITAKTGLITYSGPHFSTFGMLKGSEYTIEHFQKCLMTEQPFDVTPSEFWSDDHWYENQKKRNFRKHQGFLVINPGKASGTIIGGNLCTLNLLQGTAFMPSLEGSILFLEDDYESLPHTFDRYLQSLIHLPGFAGVRGIIIGSFQSASKMTNELLTQIIKTKKELNDIPVVANVNFGHTTPHITFAIGGTAEILAEPKNVQLIIHKH